MDYAQRRNDDLGESVIPVHVYNLVIPYVFIAYRTFVPLITLLQSVVNKYTFFGPFIWIFYFTTYKYACKYICI